MVDSLVLLLHRVDTKKLNHVKHLEINKIIIKATQDVLNNRRTGFITKTFWIVVNIIDVSKPANGISKFPF